MKTATELIRQGRKEQVWQKYCGFLDLNLQEFMDIQERLLREQLQLVAPSKLGRRVMGDDPPQDIETFRIEVPITSYSDYAPYLNAKRNDVLSEKPVVWAHTSGRSGRYKWTPYTARAFKKIGEGVLTAIILSMAQYRGDLRLGIGDTFVFNAPARPYMSGYALQSLVELFDFRFAPPADQTEDMNFQERVEMGFQMGMRTGIDIIGSISSVLIKVGESFAEGLNSFSFSPKLLHPAVLLRIARGLVRSRLQGRPMLPKDLWKVKGMLVGGSDTDIYREELIEYWGIEPHEQYACTEAPNIMSTQAWDRKGLYFLPSVCFYEFIPEEEWERLRSDETYIPRTVLLDEIEIGPHYEIVITNFYGGPFLRYRLHDLVRFVSLQDQHAGIALPSMEFAGRDSDLIDLAGFTGLIDESLIWQAIENSGISYAEWAIRKEVMEKHAGLHLYIETEEDLPSREVKNHIHQEIKALNPFYADMESVLEVDPLQVTLLTPGTFLNYMREQQAAGADLSHLKPAHMNAPDDVITKLLRLSRALSSQEKVGAS